MENALNFQTQAEAFMAMVAHRKRNPVKAGTLHVYRSLLNSRILPAIGVLEMGEVNNKTAKLLAGRLAEARLSPSTIREAVGLVAQVVGSAVDEEGNRLFKVDWNWDFIDAPSVRDQKAPTITPESLQEALGRANARIKPLIAILAGTGLRINECRALGVLGGNIWDSEAGTIEIRATMTKTGLQESPKTDAGRRVVDLDPQLNAYLVETFKGVEGPLFPLSETSYRNEIRDLGIPGFHSLRRFRITHLKSVSAPDSLIKFWVGHAAGDITECYTKMGTQIQLRKDWSVKAGLGYMLRRR